MYRKRQFEGDLFTPPCSLLVSPSSESSAMRSKQDIGRRSQLPLAPDIQLPCRQEFFSPRSPKNGEGGPLDSGRYGWVLMGNSDTKNTSNWIFWITHRYKISIEILMYNHSKHMNLKTITNLGSSKMERAYYTFAPKINKKQHLPTLNCVSTAESSTHGKNSNPKNPIGAM